MVGRGAGVFSSSNNYRRLVQTCMRCSPTWYLLTEPAGCRGIMTAAAIAEMRLLSKHGVQASELTHPSKKCFESAPRLT